MGGIGIEKYIETKSLIRLLKQTAVGKSVSYKDGFINYEDIVGIAERINTEEIDIFGNEIEEYDK